MKNEVVGFWKNFIKYQFLLRELVKKGIVLKYRRSYLGLFWTLLEPLCTMIVLTIVFGGFFGQGDRLYPVYILSGRLLYTFFNTATKGCMRSMRKNAGMMKKVYVPKYMYPLSSVLFQYVIFLISLSVLVLIGGILGVRPSIYLMQILIPLFLLLVLAFGTGMILATLAVFFRDLEYLWGIALMLIMYTSAIFYQPEKVINTGNGWVFKINPLYACIDMFRSAIFGEPLDLSMLKQAVISCVLTVGVGIYLFYKKEDQFILYL